MSAYDDEIPALVVDVGSGLVKAGFAGDDSPRTSFPTTIGGLHQSIQHPMEHGIVTNWDAMEKIWHHTFDHELRVNPEAHPILLTEAPLNPKGNREKMAQILFEQFNVPGQTPSGPSASAKLLLLFSDVRGHSRRSFLLFSRTNQRHRPGNRRWCHSHRPCLRRSAPCFSAKHLEGSLGRVLPLGVKRLDFGGRNLTDYLVRLLRDRGYSFASTAGREIVREMKEKVTYIALDYEEELATASPRTIERNYQLPDGQTFVVGTERFRCPEALFTPQVLGFNGPGIADLLHEAMMNCDVDVRRDLSASCLISGGRRETSLAGDLNWTCSFEGSSMFPGIGDRMKKELTKKVPPERRIRCVTAPERHLSVWIGGSILASLSTFQPLWISKQEYQDQGPSIVHRKCP